MSEDIADKTRRNLMFVSTGIISVAALGIPLDGKLVGAVDLKNVEPWRAWACALAVLLYTALRFYYAPSYAKLREGWDERRREVYEDLLLAHVASAIEGQRLSGKIRGVTFELPQNSFGPEFSAAVASVHNRFEMCGPRDGQVRIGWHGSSLDGSVNRSINTAAAIATFRITHTRMAGLRIRSILANYSPSWDVLEHSLPYGLLSVAFAICVHKLLEHIRT